MDLTRLECDWVATGTATRRSLLPGRANKLGEGNLRMVARMLQAEFGGPMAKIEWFHLRMIFVNRKTIRAARSPAWILGCSYFEEIALAENWN